MKKILIFIESLSETKQKLFSGLVKHLDGKVEVVMKHPNEVRIFLSQDEVTVKVGEYDLRDFGLVYFRRVARGYYGLASVLCLILDKWQIPYYDTTLKCGVGSDNKLKAYTQFALSGLPIIPTFYGDGKYLAQHKKEMDEFLGTPCVRKDLFLQRGRGVSLVSDITGVMERRQAMFQKYITAREDYRILVLGEKIGAFEKKIITKENEFRSNVALGAREEFMEVTDIPADFKKLAQAAAKAAEVEVAGVDLLVDKDGICWLLEVNRGPGFTYDDPNSDEVKNLATFLEESLK
jgi:hypothetical protein